VNRILPVVASTLFVFSMCAWAQTAAQPNKVGVIHFEGAISATQQGQKALNDLQARYDPKKRELEKRQTDLAAKREQLSKGATTMSEEAKAKLTQEIDQTTRGLSRDLDDAQSDYQQDVNRILQDFYPRIRAVLDKYAKDNGYSVILDIGSQQTPVVYMADSVDMTNDIVALYDKSNPVAAASVAPPAAKPAAAPAKPTASAPPAVPPATK
jgi:outer membrane protein